MQLAILRRVGEDVATLAPHRPGRADFPHPVPRGEVSLTAASRLTILAINDPSRCHPSLAERETPRQCGYPSPFRRQVCRAHVPSRVSRRWLFPRDASLPSRGSRRARFPALGGTMKALRLPTRASTDTHWFCARSPRDPSSFVFAVALPEGRRSLPGLALCWCRRPISGLLSRGREWDLSGLQAILPVPLLRSGTPVEPTCPRHVGHVDVAPAGWTAKASANLISGLTRSFGTCCHTLHAVIAAHVQGLLPAGWLPFTGWVSNPLDRYERFQLVLTVIHPSCSPDATTLHAECYITDRIWNWRHACPRRF